MINILTEVIILSLILDFNIFKGKILVFYTLLKRETFDVIYFLDHSY